VLVLRKLHKVSDLNGHENVGLKQRMLQIAGELGVIRAMLLPLLCATVWEMQFMCMPVLSGVANAHPSHAVQTCLAAASSTTRARTNSDDDQERVSCVAISIDLAQ
jgi:hypothetical protein